MILSHFEFRARNIALSNSTQLQAIQKYVLARTCIKTIHILLIVNKPN